MKCASFSWVSKEFLMWHPGPSRARSDHRFSEAQIRIDSWQASKRRDVWLNGHRTRTIGIPRLDMYETIQLRITCEIWLILLKTTKCILFSGAQLMKTPRLSVFALEKYWNRWPHGKFSREVHDGPRKTQERGIELCHLYLNIILKNNRKYKFEIIPNHLVQRI